MGTTEMDSDPPPNLVRVLGRWTLVALMLNSVIGSGIFGLPSIVAGLVGSASPLAYLAAAVGMGVIMACFAEVASRFREAGGTYLYARQAFGRWMGIEIAWLTWLMRLTGAAAGANLFVLYLAEFRPEAKLPIPRLAILTLLVGFIAAVNYRGVRAGARLSNVFTAAKLAPLAVFIGVGLFFVPAGSLRPRISAGAGTWLDAVLVAIFAFGGFEGALMPMGEAKHPERDAPFAIFVTLAVVTLVYVLVQVVVVGALPEPGRAESPLAAAARVFMGAPGAALITLGALISVVGYLGAMMLNVPRLTFALAERRDFPPLFAAVHSRFRTPHVSILAFALLLWLLAAAGSFRWNVILSTMTRLFIYGFTCAALVTLRKKLPSGGGFRLPAGAAFALVGIGFSLVLLTRLGRGELKLIAATMGIALFNWLWAKRREKQ